MARNKRKNKNAKIQGQYRKLKKQQELKVLEDKLQELKEEKRARQIRNLKNLGIRNLKFFGYACNFIMPYVVTAGITIGAFKIFNGGLPFAKDDIIKYKMINLESDASENILVEEKYQENHWYSDAIPSSSLQIVYPWIESPGVGYTQVTRYYDVSTSTELINAIIEKNIEKINELLPKYDEEIKQTNEYKNTDEKPTIIANIHFLNKKDVLKYSESDLKNIIITSTEILLTFIIGSIVAYFRHFNIIISIKDTNQQYKIESTKTLNNEIIKTGALIRKLKKAVL
jgi:hypothetical protein